MAISRMAVVVVNYNGGDDVVDCLASLAAEEPAAVVVVDNASTDGSPEAIESRLPSVRLLRSASNRGFAAAANLGVRATDQDYVFLVNPDAVVAPGCLLALERLLDQHDDAGVAGALVLNPDGSVQPTKRAFPGWWQAAMHAVIGPLWPNNPGTRAYVLAGASFVEARRVDWVAGTAMALRRSAFDAVGGFDEDFFFFVEDVDLCRRVWDAGFEVWFDPSAAVTHQWGGSWTKQPLRFLLMHQRNVFRYVRKHRRGPWVAAYPLVAAALAVRFLLLAIRWLFTKRSVPRHRSLKEENAA